MMIKWEYKTHFYVEDWAPDDPGKDGWELVAVVSSNRGMAGSWFYFKRLLEEATPDES